MYLRGSAIVCVTVFIALPAQTAFVLKANNTLDVNLGSSWAGGIPPGPANIAQWSTTVTAANTVALGDDLTWLGLQLTAPGGTVTISGANTLALGSSGIDLSAATQDLVLQTPLALIANQSWLASSARTININRPVSGNALITLPGPGTILLDAGTTADYTLGTSTAGNNALALNGGTLRLLSGTLTLNSNNNSNDGSHINGNSTFHLAGGTVNSSFYTRLGSGAAGTLSTLLVSGGTFLNRGEILFGFGGSGSGTLNLQSTGIVDAHFLRLGDTSSAGTHTVNLDGGRLKADRIFRNNGTPVFNFNSGVLQANANPSTPWFAASVQNVWVKNGGAHIDTTGRNVRMDPGLRAFPGSTGGLTKLGEGTLTLLGTNTYSGPTTVSDGTLLIDGVSTGSGLVNVQHHATLGGTGSVLAPVSILNGGTIAPGPGRLTVGNLTLQPESILSLTLGTENDPANSTLHVNGDLVLDGSVIITDTGAISTGAVYTAISYTGSLSDNGLKAHPHSGWDVTVDTSIPSLVRITTTRKFPFIEISGGDLTVTTLFTNLTAIIHGQTTNFVWYELRPHTLADGSSGSNLPDFGAHVPSTLWPFTVRHVKEGTNYLTVFARDNSGVTFSNTVRLLLSLPYDTQVRPRPIPAEIWWGGLSTNQQLLDPGRPWEFVKKFQDGLFFHSAGYGGLTSENKRNLATMLRPYNTRYWVELGGGVNTTPGPAWVQFQAISGWGAHLASQQNLGLVMSQITHDYHMENMEDVCRVHPAWPATDQVAWWTGDLYRATPAYPESSGLWRDIFTIYYTNNPHLKVGHTSSPVWWPWDAYPALAANHLLYNPLRDANGTPIQVDGTNVNFSFTASEIVNGFINMAANIRHPWFSFQSDCPWDYYGTWGNITQRTNNRAKIRHYESVLHQRGARHTLICNVSNAGSRPGGDDAQDLYYKQSSLNSMFLHQQEGGRANVYLFESWYHGIPHTAAPESKSGSYANLAMDAIKYLKGIKDTNGTLQQLSLTILSRGQTNTVELRNLGDITCLPAILALEAPGGTGPVTYLNSEGRNITSEILSAGGYAHTNMLAPGAATQVRIISQGAALNRTVTLEAFWNPQDPTGIVRDRLFLTPPNQAPFLSPISNQFLIAGQTLFVTNIASDPDLPLQTLTFSLIAGPTNALLNPASGLLSWRPLIAQAPLVTQFKIAVADNGSPSLSHTQSFWASVGEPQQPSLGLPSFIPTGFQFHVEGSIGPDYTVLASTNLIHWSTILTTNPPSLPFLFRDPGSYEQSSRFYRVQIGP